MRIGWTGYTSLRRDLIAPIGSCDQYYPAMLDLRKWTGEPVHWMPLKCLVPDCHIPNPATAEPDELEVHASVVHYGDNFQKMMRYVNTAPTTNRHIWLSENRPPKELFKYDYPELDILIVEATGQMGGAYGVNEVARSCWEKNPNLGLIVIDQDLTAGTTISKIKKWLPNWQERIVVATYHFGRRYAQQVVTIIPQLSYRQLPQSLDHDYLECAYVGNDYRRRDTMLQFFTNERMHHYGRIKDDFIGTFGAAGGVVHGPFVPNKDFNLEQLYYQHGAGLNIARFDAYKIQLITGRLSEIVRGGAIAFCDAKLQIATALLGEWFMVVNGDQVREKLDILVRHPDLWREYFEYQRAALSYYTSHERYSMSLYEAGKRLMEGPIRGPWHFNPYKDLLLAAKLPQWSDRA